MYSMSLKRGRDQDPSGVVDDCSAPEAKRSNNNVTNNKTIQPLCPYLDTINRQLLDFDTEKLCSITLTNRNIYACLVCGRFYEGRGKTTPAYTHSVEHNHYVFMNTESGRAFCLPDNYEIIDNSLSDIRRSLQPSFSLRAITGLEKNTQLARDVHNVSYLPGYVGLNNLGATDGINVTLHLLAHIGPLRDFFLQPKLYSTAAAESKLLRDFGLMMRKLWSSDNFKSTISPQELVQTLSVESKRRFSIGRRCEVADLLIWLLHTLQRLIDQKETTKSNTKVISESLQGLVQVTTLSKPLVDDYQQQQLLQNQQKQKNVVVNTEGWTVCETISQFTCLSLDIPPCPLFRDSQGGLVIPQIPLFQLLQRKFDGRQFVDTVTKQAHQRRQYKLLSLPQTLILHLCRFTKNNFALEKNPTIVTFPVKNLEMKDYLFVNNDGSDAGQRERDKLLQHCPSSADCVDEIVDIDRLMNMVRDFGAPLHLQELDCLLLMRPLSASSTSNISTNIQISPEEWLAELREIARRAIERVLLFRSTKYDLVSCVCHVSDNAARNIDVGDVNLSSAYSSQGNENSNRRKAVAAVHTVHAALNSNNNHGNNSNSNEANNSAERETDADVVQRGTYKMYLSLNPTGQWFELQDLAVNETSAQQVGVSEAYILVYQKKLPTAAFSSTL